MLCRAIYTCGQLYFLLNANIKVRFMEHFVQFSNESKILAGRKMTVSTRTQYEYRLGSGLRSWYLYKTRVFLWGKRSGFWCGILSYIGSYYTYSETYLKRPPKGPANSGRYREVVRIGSATLTCAKSRSMLSLIYCSFDFVIQPEFNYMGLGNNDQR